MNILAAYQLAAGLHAGQVDKAGRPYIEHLSRVFLRVLEAGGDRYQQIAALLHDAIEDGKATADQLLEAGVPKEAVDLVVVLSRKPGQDYNAYVLLVKGYHRAVLVKASDLADNMDAGRLALLPMEVATRLDSKYRGALDLLRA